MFRTLKQIFNDNNKDLRKRILFTLMALFIFKLGTTIIVPVIPKEALRMGNLGFLELMNVMGGGALERFSIFSLGVAPYISASIVVQILQMDIIPYFSELSKQGHTGRTKLNIITRVLGIALAFLQGYVFAITYIKEGSLILHMEIAVILTAGTAFLLWLGDQITAKGVGNGVSLLIMAGIIMSLPNMFYQAWGEIVGSTIKVLPAIKYGVFVILYFIIVIGVVFEQLAERRVPVQYANKSAGSMTGVGSYMPFKLNAAGVMPVILASVLMSIPGIIANLMKKPGFTNFVSEYLTYTKPVGFIIYILVIIMFTYVYVYLQVKPDKMAEDLQKNGGYIPGVRPGKETVKYISDVLYKLTFVGALSLAVLAALPILFATYSKLSPNITIGGTGLLIVVGVALETYKQVESHLITRSYTRGRRRK